MMDFSLMCTGEHTLLLVGKDRFFFRWNVVYLWHIFWLRCLTEISHNRNDGRWKNKAIQTIQILAQRVISWKSLVKLSTPQQYLQYWNSFYATCRVSLCWRYNTSVCVWVCDFPLSFNAIFMSLPFLLASALCSREKRLSSLLLKCVKRTSAHFMNIMQRTM